MKTVTMAPPVGGAKRLFTADEYHKLVPAGVLREDDRVELIHGEIVWMEPIGREHASCTDYLDDEFHSIPRQRVHVRNQGPVTLSAHDEPQPDISLLRRRPDRYRAKGPSPEDMLLAVEVSDSTLSFDRRTKIPLYAAAGVREAWIVNIPEQCIEVYRKPSRRGYREVKRYRRGDSVSPLAFPDFSLRVDDVLGPK